MCTVVLFLFIFVCLFYVCCCCLFAVFCFVILFLKKSDCVDSYLCALKHAVGAFLDLYKSNLHFSSLLYFLVFVHYLLPCVIGLYLCKFIAILWRLGNRLCKCYNDVF